MLFSPLWPDRTDSPASSGRPAPNKTITLSLGALPVQVGTFPRTYGRIPNPQGRIPCHQEMNLCKQRANQQETVRNTHSIYQWLVIIKGLLYPTSVSVANANLYLAIMTFYFKNYNRLITICIDKLDSNRVFFVGRHYPKSR